MPMLLVTLIEFLCRRFWLTFESHGPTVVVLAHARPLFWLIGPMGPKPIANTCVRVASGP